MVLKLKKNVSFSNMRF